MSAGVNPFGESNPITPDGLPLNPLYFFLDVGVCMFETSRRLWYEPRTALGSFVFGGGDNERTEIRSNFVQFLPAVTLIAGVIYGR